MLHPTQIKIDDFLSKWPGAEYGPAHIVLSDYNLDDDHIKNCMRHLEFARYEIASGSNTVPTHSVDELSATLEFLSELKAIPEDERRVLDE